MAKTPVSDPHVESDEESAEKETSSEEVHNDAGSDTESGSEPETESKQTNNGQKAVDGENQEQQTSDSSSEDEGEGEAEAEGDEEGDAEEEAEEEEEESQSESDSDGGRVTKSDPIVKPISSKPLDGAPAPKKGRPRTASLSSTSKKAAAGDKRPATSETGGDGEVTEAKRPYKRTKKGIQQSVKKPPTTNSKPRKYFKRLWSEEDELAILKGMADFYAAKKMDPFIHLDAFHEFIKKLIHVDVRKSQLQDKIRKMRMKYLNAAENENKGLGKGFNTDHDRKAFDLSKKVWGNETISGGISSGRSGRGAPSARINGDSVKRTTTKNANAKTKKVAPAPVPVPVITDVVVHEDAKEGGHELDGSSNGLEERLKGVNWGAQNLGIEEWSVQNSIHLVDGESRAELEEKWRRFRAEEAELQCKRLDFLREEAKLQSKKLELLSEEAKLVADALKSSRG